jgi:hypothetical protein
MDIENHGCTIVSDFRDYYDHLLGCHSNAKEFRLIRKHSEKMTVAEQNRFLNSRGVHALHFSKKGGVIERPLHTHLLLSQNDGSLFKVDVRNSDIIPNESMVSPQIEVSDNKGPLVFCKYLKIGHLYAWAICVAPWLEDGSLGPYEVMSISDNEEDDIEHSVGQCLTAPLYEIDIMNSSAGNLAFRYSTSPNLEAIGVNCIYTEREVADALLGYVLPEPPSEKESSLA